MSHRQPSRPLPPLPVRQEEVPFYRGQTLKILRPYLRLSMEMGHLPALVGTLFFRARVTSTRHASFEDGVIFVHDVDRCLELLESFEKLLIGRAVLQEFSQAEIARALHVTERMVRYKLCDALDHLSDLFLRLEIMPPRLISSSSQAAGESCQDVEKLKNDVSE